MSERDELLKKIEGESNIENNPSGPRLATAGNNEVGQYNKANTNLNVALNNPPMNVNDNSSVNIINSLGNDNTSDQPMPISEIALQSQVSNFQSPTPNPTTVNPVAQGIQNEVVNNRFINNPESIEGYTQQAPQNQNDNTKYVATYQSTGKKNKGSFKIKMSKETQLIFIIFLIIFVFILVLPNITDLSKNVTSTSFWEKVGEFFKNLFKRG